MERTSTATFTRKEYVGDKRKKNEDWEILCRSRVVYNNEGDKTNET